MCQKLVSTPWFPYIVIEYGENVNNTTIHNLSRVSKHRPKETISSYRDISLE